MADEGASYAYIDNAINSLRREFQSDLQELRREFEREVERLEAEMRQVGAMIVEELRHQTAAMTAELAAITVELAAGTAATNEVVENTRRQIEEDFAKTRGRLDAQIESTLQIEVGKKVAEASGIQDKIKAFVRDIQSRFDRAIFTGAQNRELYNVAFRNLTEEYQSKIQSIGAHIFQIRFDDIAPAFRAASVPYEDAHSLPIEMDLKRLEMRSAQLDQTLELLRSSRLNEAAGSLEMLDAELAAASADAPASAADHDYCVEALLTRSPLSTRIHTGVIAQTVSTGRDVNLTTPQTDLEAFTSAPPELMRGLGRTRRATEGESARLTSAARALSRRGLISEESLAQFEAFLASGGLRLIEV